MKNVIFFLFIFFSYHSIVYSQTSYVWNGSSSTDWNTNSNWTPNGIPGAADNATIVSGSNDCYLAGNTTLTNLTITTGILNLNGFTLNTTGIVACNGGSCNNGTFNSTATSLTFAGTTFGANITANVGDVYFNGSTFNGSLTVVKNSATSIQSNGNNTFNGTTSITNAGTGYLMLTNGAVGRNDRFNGATTFNTSNTGALYIGYQRNIIFNANVTINNTASTGLIQIGRVGSVTLNPGNTITCGTFAGTTLNLYNLSQTGSTALTLSPGSTGAVNIYGSSISGSLTINAGIITAQTSTFAAAVNYNVSGTIMNNWSSGGNTYNGVLTVNNSSNGYIGFANGTADIYNDDVYANNTSMSGGRIIFGNNCTSQFNGNIYVSQSGPNIASGGIAIGWGGTFPIINIAAGKSIITAGTYNSGYLQLNRIQQTDPTPITLNTSGTTNVILNGNILLGDFSVTAPDITPNGGTYNGVTTFNKTGGTNNHNNGNLNIFNSTCTINQTSSTGYFMLGNNSADQFNDNIIVTSTGTGGIRLGHNGGTGTPTLASGKTINVGGAGFNSGYLLFGSFTQLGSAPINLNTTGNAAIYIENANSNCVFGGSFTATAADIYVQGGTFNNTTTLTKTGGIDNHNAGVENIFNAPLFINQQSNSGYFMLGYNSADKFNDDIIVTNTGSTNRGIYIGFSGGTGAPVLAAGKKISIGATGFNDGFLYLGNLTQLGSAPLNLALTGTSTTLYIRNSNIGGSLTSSSANFWISGSTFNGIFDVTKTGSTTDQWPGGNTFNSISSITNSGTGLLRLGTSNPDIFNNDITFTSSGSGYIEPSYNSTGNIYNGNITLNSISSSSGINFGPGGLSTSTLAATKTIQIGALGYSSGYLILQRFTQLGNAPINLTLPVGSNYFSIGPNSTIGGNLTVDAQSINNIRQSTFNGIVSITKNGNTNDTWTGGNTFNSTSTFINNTAGYLLLGNGSPDIFNDDVTFTNTGSERILPAYSSAGNQFNGNINVNSIGSSVGIHFCSQAISTATLAATKTIQVGGSGFTSGYLILPRFTQLGNAPINLTLSPGSNYLQYGPSSSIGGNVTSVSPRLLFNGCTFNGNVTCTKSGAIDDSGIGNNVFNGITTITNSGSGYLMFGNGNNDQFNNDATFINTGTNNMHIAYNSSNNIFAGVTTFSNTPSGNFGIYVSSYSSGTLFNENIIVTSTGGTGVQFCSGNTSASSTLASSKTISIGASGFSAGTLLLKQFTQLSSTPQTLIQTTGAGILTLGPNSTFNGNVDFNFPQVFLNGTTYNGVTTIQKNGATDNSGTGGNVFNNTTTITNSGSGHLLTGNNNADVFNAATIFNNNGSNRFYFAHNHNGQTTVFNQPLIINSNKSGGTDTWSYFICEGTNSSVNFMSDVTYNVNGTLQSNCRILNGTGSSATYNGNLNINLSNTHTSTQIQLGTAGQSVYNNNILINHIGTGTSSGVYFNTSATASSTLANTKTISIGASGFNVGTLSLLRFIQLGNTTQTLAQTTGTGIILIGTGTIFNADVNINFPQVLLNGATYNGITSIQKNGTGDNDCAGGNTFNNTTNITNVSSNRLRLANSSTDNYNSDITFVQNNNGVLAPNYNANCNYSGNVTVSSSGTFTITFGSGSGIATFTGSNAQSINKSGSIANPVFSRFIINKTSNDLTLNTRINITNSLTLTQGLINTTSSNILNMNNAATTSIGNALSYINGPMNYDMALNGSRTLNFPIGKVADWRPAVLVATHNAGTSYTYKAEVTNADAQNLGYTKPATVDVISQVHWWDIDRSVTASGVASPTTNVSGNQTITLYYGTNDAVTDPTNLTIVKNRFNASSTWFDIGGVGSSAGTGSITSTSTPSAFNSFSRFTIANRIGGVNPLPVELLYLNAYPNEKKVNLDWATASETNNSHFEIERSSDGVNFEYIASINAHGDGNSLSKQTYTSVDEKPYKGISYYRLKQVDKTTEFKYTHVVSVEFKDNSYVNIFPNPAHSNIIIKASGDYINASLKVINTLGVEVVANQSLETFNGLVDLSHLANGIYYVVIQKGEQTENIKISLQK